MSRELSGSDPSERGLCAARVVLHMQRCVVVALAAEEVGMLKLLTSLPYSMHSTIGS